MILTASEPKFNNKMPLMIDEDSDDELFVSERGCPKKNIAHRRCVSLPLILKKSIMKKRTLDESLHSTYGSEDELITGRDKERDSLQFDKIKIREYSRTVGDNPSCSSGPPVSISWEYNIIGEIDLDEYEKARPPRRIQHEMVLPRNMREDLLRYEWNASRQEITESIRQNVKIKNQRRTTVNNLGKASKFEEAMESASRKLKRFVKGQKSVHKQVQALQEQVEASNKRRSKLIYLEQSMFNEVDESAPTQETDSYHGVCLSGSGNGSVTS